jgi:hypothetical protein
MLLPTRAIVVGEIVGVDVVSAPVVAVADADS